LPEDPDDSESEGYCVWDCEWEVGWFNPVIENLDDEGVEWCE